jgi:molybdenum cofactor synthesis domain-containing protein
VQSLVVRRGCYLYCDSPAVTTDSTSDADAPTAGVLLIGDELLSGKICDENGHFLAKVLRRRGVRLIEMAVVGDTEEAIGEALMRMVGRASLVFTSGGVGPTHDDRTLPAIAAATGRRLRRDPQMEQLLREHFGERITPAALGMADLPEGTSLRALPGWPVLRLDLFEPRVCRVYILPGVPPLLRAKVEHLEGLEGELPKAAGWHLSLLHTTIEESALAANLDALVASFPEVEIGSYPRWARDEGGRVRYHVRITFEAPAAHAASAEAARDRLAEMLGPDAVVPSPDASTL